VVEAHCGNQGWQIIPSYEQTGQSVVYKSSYAANRRIILNNAAYSQVRLRASAWTSGTANVTYIGNSGTLLIYAAAAMQDTYRGVALAFAPANTATDIFTITGSATRTVKVTKIKVSATRTLGGLINIVVLRRSTANSGASNAITEVAYDTNSPVATATLRYYTANPTLGTLVANVDAIKYYATNTVTAIDAVHEFNFGERYGTLPIVLRGTGEVLAVNLNSTTVSGGSFNISAEWVEE